MLRLSGAPVVVEAKPTGKRACADQLERRQRLSGPVERLKDRANRLQIGGLRQYGDRERVSNERLDEGLLHVVQKRAHAVRIVIAARSDDAVDPADGVSVPDPRERHQQRARLGLDRRQSLDAVGRQDTNALVDLCSSQQAADVEEEARLADAEQRLVEGGETLLAIEDQVRRLPLRLGRLLGGSGLEPRASALGGTGGCPRESL